MINEDQNALGNLEALRLIFNGQSHDQIGRDPQPNGESRIIVPGQNQNGGLKSPIENRQYEENKESSGEQQEHREIGMAEGADPRFVVRGNLRQY